MSKDIALENLLTEIDNLKPVTVRTEEDIDNLPVLIKFSPVDQRTIMRKYLEGATKQSLADAYNVSTRTITTLIEKNNDLRTQMEKQYLNTALSRENYRLSEAKDKLISFINKTLEDAESSGEMSTEARMKVFNNVAAVFDKLSITSRLNQEKATNINEKRTIDVDVAKITEQLTTNEDKLNFLRNQKANTPIKAYEGEVVTTE